MSKEIRGSEKLKRECSGRLLSKEELEQVSGGVSQSAFNSVYRVFPLGIPWPDIYNKMDQVLTPIGGDLRVPDVKGQIGF